MLTQKNIIIFLSVVLVVAIVVIGVLLAERPTSSGGVTGGVMIPATPPMPSSPDGLLHSLAGQVVSVANGSITVSAVLAGKTAPSTVTVAIQSDTTYTLQVPIDPAEFAKKMNAYQQQMASSSAGGTIATPPIPYTTKTMALSDIKAGMSVTVVPVSNTKEGTASITAQSIEVFVAPAVPAVTTPTVPPTSVGAAPSPSSVPPAPVNTPTPAPTPAR